MSCTHLADSRHAPTRARCLAGGTYTAIGLSTVLSAVAALLAAAPLSAQIVRGRIVDKVTQAPIQGAFILLVDSAGGQQRGVLSGSSGDFVLEAPGAGRYTLRAERIGYEDTMSDPLDLAVDQVLAYRFEIAVKAVNLAGMEVTGKGRCRITKEMGVQTTALWEEVRKALSIAVWGEEERGVPFQASLFSRARDASSGKIESDTVTFVSGYGRTPFASETARSLGTDGYIRQLSDGSFMFYGLDAKTLLSDDFLERHCFRVQQAGEEQAGLIGLGFAPLNRKGPPDIEGTLWVDRATAELRYLEFEYSKLPMNVSVNRELFGGRMDFQRLDNGDWVVRHWWLRMPESIRYRTKEEMRAAARRHYIRIRERGGEVRLIGSVGTSAEGAGAPLVGVVWDSTRAVPLAGATVFLTDVARSTTADQAGRFRLTDVPPGPHRIAFADHRVDALALPVSTRTVIVPPEDSTSLTLAIPRDAACAPSTTTGGMVGFVEDAETGDPIPGAAVRVVPVAWGPVGVEAPPPSEPQPGERTVAADADGRYVVCGLPVNQVMEMLAGGPIVYVQLPGPVLKRQELIARIDGGKK
jgi:hypothetical protein